MVRQLGQLRPPAVAEVVKCVPVNTILGSELEREQSPGNGPVPTVGRETHSKAHSFPWAIQPFQGLERVQKLSTRPERCIDSLQSLHRQSFLMLSLRMLI